MINEITIKGGTSRYLSDIPFFKENGMPYGVINKSGADKGGTFFVANNPDNYVIVVPFRDLVDSVCADKNNKYPIIGVYGGIDHYKFKKQFDNSGPVKKIIVTWDSFYKLASWINTSDYKVLIDEYHMTLSEMGFRAEAINSLLNELKEYQYYSFLSATPIKPEFEYDFLKDLPHYKIEWDDIITINPARLNTPYVYKSASKIISDFMDGNLYAPDINGEETEVKELYIFLNSVTKIKQLCDDSGLTPNDVRIICGDKVRNRISLGEFSIGKVTDPNAKVNFFTKKGYQGCNFFTNNGLIIVITDSKNENTFISVDEDLEQICGRLRSNSEYKNMLGNTLIHIYSTNKLVESQEEFDDRIEKSKSALIEMKSALDLMNDRQKTEFLTRMNCDNDVFVIEDNNLNYSANKENAFRYRFSLKQMYSNGIQIRDAFKESRKFNIDKEEAFKGFEIKLGKYKKVNFKEVLTGYYQTEDTAYLDGHPKFKEYVKYLTIKECASLKWKEDLLDKAVNDKQKLDKMFLELHQDGFRSSSYLKEKISEYFKKEGITLSPKASLFKDNRFYTVTETKKTIGGKSIKGYEFGPLNLKKQI